MFGQEFFPTPKPLIEKMLQPYLNKDGLMSYIDVLEPSAGKGDIADFIKEAMDCHWRGHGSEKIHVIEINPDLSAILREKGFMVIGDDFLKYSGNGIFYDLIVMNPPFSNGAEHCIHAWNILRTGDLVCLLNQETIDNPYTKERQLLVNIIKENNGIVEHIGTPFSIDAERKTDVNVVIVRLHKEKDTTVDGLFNSVKLDKPVNLNEETPLINENQIACRDIIQRMVDQYTSTIASFSEALVAIRKMAYYGDEFSGSFNDNERGIFEVFYKSAAPHLLSFSNQEEFSKAYKESYNEFLNKVRLAAWNSVFKKTQISNFMTEGVRREFNNLKEIQQYVEFTPENITRILEALVMNKGKIASGAIDEAFDLITKYHEENRVYPEGWKTNKCWKAGKKFILPYCVEFSCGSIHYSYRRGQELDDIDRALCFILGIRFDSVTSTSKFIQAAIDRRQRETESKFFKIKWYKKGTGHFTFLDEDLWERFNVIACRNRKWLPDS